MLRQTHNFSRSKYDDIQAKLLQGDVSGAMEAVSLSDFIPALNFFLSNETLEWARTFTDSLLDSPPMLTALPLLKTLHAFLLKELNPSPDILSSLSSIVPCLLEWLYLLVEGMGILSVDFSGLSAEHTRLVEHISILIHGLVQYPSIYHQVRVAPGFVDVFMTCWIRTSAAGCYIAQVSFATILLSIFIEEDEQDSVVLDAIMERPEEVAKAAVQGLVSCVNEPSPEDFERLILIVLEAMDMNTCSPICVRALLANNALTWLCRLADRVLDSISDRTLYMRILRSVMKDLGALLLKSHANNVALVLQANILEIVLCADSISRVSDIDAPSDAGVSSDMLKLQKTLLSIIATLTGFVVYRSLLSHFRKSIRRIERESLAEGASPVLEAYRELVRLVRTRSEWIISHDAFSTRCSCVNPNCLCKSGLRQCTRADLQQCLGCSFAIYCSRACQKEHWTRGGHKVHCSRLDAARLKGSQLLPISPRDAAALYATIVEDTTHPAREFFGNDEGRNPARVLRESGFDEETTVLNIEFEEAGHVQLVPMSLFRLTGNTLEELVERVVEKNGAVSDKDHFEGYVRAMEGGPLVGITLANDILVDLTNVSRIRRGIYPAEIYGDVNMC